MEKRVVGRKNIRAASVPFIWLCGSNRTIRPATAHYYTVTLENVTWGMISKEIRDAIECMKKQLSAEKPGTTTISEFDEGFFHEPLPKDVLLYFSFMGQDNVGIVVLPICKDNLNKVITSVMFTFVTAH